MKIRRFYGKDMREALKQVKDELGKDAVIMSNKRLADGVELVAAYDQEPVSEPKVRDNQSSSRRNNLLNVDTNHSEQPRSVRNSSLHHTGQNAPTSLSEIIGDSGPDSLRELLEKQAGASLAEPAYKEPIQKPVSKVEPPQPTFDAQTLPSAVNDDINDIKLELQSLRSVLEHQVSGLVSQKNRKVHPLQAYLIDHLQQVGISIELAKEAVAYMPDNCNEREAWLYLLKLLANRLKTNQNDILTEGGVVALVGPTGTGKTTTIAKLAARYAQKHGPGSVLLITTDTYRIAAYEQLATYGKIIGCTVKKATDAKDLSDLLFQYRAKSLIMIDTAGFGQRDVRLVSQLDTLKDCNCANIKKYVVLQANAQYRVMSKILDSYKKISLQGCIFTKVDECYSLGEAVSAAIEFGIPLSYVTDGQKVPEDIKVADSKQLISKAAKLLRDHNSVPVTRKRMVNAAVAV
jgi:flagellar biosynthesis protein FlhF